MPIKGSRFPIRPCRWCGVEVIHAMDGFHPRQHFCEHAHIEPGIGLVRHVCWEGSWFGRPYAQPPGASAPWVRRQFVPVLQFGCLECLEDYRRAVALDEALDRELGPDGGIDSTVLARSGGCD